MNNIKKQLITNLEKCDSILDIHSVIEDFYTLNISIESILGSYLIEGHNQDENNTPYTGQLEIKTNQFGELKAVWVIGKDQLQFGTGFLHKNTLVFNFYYEGEGDYIGKQFKGIVIYTILPNGELKGFWSEKYGDQRFLGKENAKKRSPLKTEFSLN